MFKLDLDIFDIWIYLFWRCLRPLVRRWKKLSLKYVTQLVFYLISLCLMFRIVFLNNNNNKKVGEKHSYQHRTINTHVSTPLDSRNHSIQFDVNHDPHPLRKDIHVKNHF